MSGLRLTWQNYLCFLFVIIFMIFANYTLVLAGESMINTELDDTTITLNETGYENESVENGLKGKLIFSHVIFRHGDRTPVEPYPSDPYKTLDNWPTGWGQLTNLGKEQEYELGKWLRYRYNTLLNKTYSKDEIYIRSTDVDRTLMSALSVLAGLYPPTDNQIWNKNILWQPIPVHTVPEKYDFVLAGKAPCPAYEYALNNLKNSPAFIKMRKTYATLFEYISKYADIKIESLEAAQRINNTLLIETIYNKTLPEWTKAIYPSPELTYISNFAFSVFTYTRQMARLRVGSLIREILDRSANKVKQKLKPNRSVWIYSAHDTTIANILNALKVFDIHSPPYTACIVFELRVDDEQNPFITVFYRNSTAEPKPINIPDCGIACPLNKMYELYDEILPINWDRECEMSRVMKTLEDVNLGIATGILVSIITITLFLSYLIMIYYRRRNYRNYFTYTQINKQICNDDKILIKSKDINNEFRQRKPIKI